MARTNFQDEVYKDPNYQDMLLEVGDQYKMRGILIVAWELAQKHWIAHKGVPADKWPEALYVLVKYKFAKEEIRQVIPEDGEGKPTEAKFIYVAGSAEHCAFLDKQSKNGAKGGQSKSPKKLKNLKQNRSQTEATPKPDRSQKNPTEASYSSSYSSSNSIIPNTTYSGEGAQPPAPISKKNAVALWMEAYHRRYKSRYPALGKDTGTLTGLEKTYNSHQLEILFACYLAIKEPLYESQKHPLSLFFRDLPKISVAAETGVDPSKPAKFNVSKLKD